MRVIKNITETKAVLVGRREVVSCDKCGAVAETRSGQVADGWTLVEPMAGDKCAVLDGWLSGTEFVDVANNLRGRSADLCPACVVDLVPELNWSVRGEAPQDG